MLTGVQIKEGVELLHPPKFQILPESQSQNNYGTTIISITIVINWNHKSRWRIGKNQHKSIQGPSYSNRQPEETLSENDWFPLHQR